MTEVDRQVRQPVFDVATLAMPTCEAIHREGVPERMESRSALSSRGMNSRVTEQSLEGDARGDVIQAPALNAGEEGDRRWTTQGRRSQRKVRSQLICCRRMKDDDA